MNRNKKRNLELRQEWALAQPPWCQACGIGDEAGAFQYGGIRPSVHHIIRASGRSDELTCFLKLCARCHDLAEGRCIRVNGEKLPNLPLAVCLWIKREREPHLYDPDRLRALRGQTLPEPERSPFEDVYLSRHDAAHHLRGPHNLERS